MPDYPLKHKKTDVYISMEMSMTGSLQQMQNFVIVEK